MIDRKIGRMAYKVNEYKLSGKYVEKFKIQLERVINFLNERYNIKIITLQFGLNNDDIIKEKITLLLKFTSK